MQVHRIERVRYIHFAQGMFKSVLNHLRTMAPHTRQLIITVAKIDALQIEYSPWFTDHEDSGLISLAKELGVEIIAYSPLGKGILSGKYVVFPLRLRHAQRVI